jgi:hypothetical protein
MKRFLRTPDAARYCGVSPRTLEKWRVSGGGPPYSRPPKRHFVVYHVDDLEAWLGSGRRRSTSDSPAAEAHPVAT